MTRQTKELPTQKYLQECFEIHADGLYWKNRPKSHFNSGVDQTTYKGKHTHVECFTSPEEVYTVYLVKAESLVDDFAIGG